MQISKKLAKTAAITIVLLMASVTLMASQFASSSSNIHKYAGNYAVPLPAGVTPD